MPISLGQKICLPKPVGLEGISNLLLLELQDFADFARILVLMWFLSDNLQCVPFAIKTNRISSEADQTAINRVPFC